MKALDIERALRTHLDFGATFCVPEASVQITETTTRYGSGTYERVIHDYRADFITVSDAGYATEYEVKISRSDWKADLTKSKWSNMPGWINRFIYVVPEELGIPDWVPPFAGVWHVYERGTRYGIKVARQPKRIGKDKVPEPVKARWLRNIYYRYWSNRIAKDKANIRAGH